jgi:hypothetical protein
MVKVFIKCTVLDRLYFSAVGSFSNIYRDVNLLLCTQKQKDNLVRRCNLAMYHELLGTNRSM